ncbi:MAG TPA: hypothetical protein VGN26_05450 [Armatimonadota bacterium]|jgi:hypothetical protein
MEPRLGKVARAAACAILLLLGGLASPLNAAEADLSRDDRLATEVTVALEKVPLGAVARALGTQTGAAILAGWDSKDWPSRELPVSIFAKRKPARVLMKQLAQLLDLHWSASGSGEARTYRVWQDQRGRDLQATQAQDLERAEIRERAERAFKDLSSIAALADMTPQQPAEAAKRNPVAALVASNPSYRSFPRMIASLTPEQRLRCGTAQGVRIAYSQMDPRLQDDVRTCATIIHGFWRRLDPTKAEQPDTSTPSFDKAALVIRPLRPEDGIDLPGISEQLSSIVTVEGVEGLEPVPGPPGIPIADPESPAGQLFNRFVTAGLQGAPMGVLESVALLGSAQAVAAKAALPPAPPPTDPELLREVKLEGLKSRVSPAELLRALHQASGLDILADDLPQPGLDGGLSAPTPETKIPLYQVLDQLRSACGLEYTRQGTTLLLRDRLWPRKRGWLIPQSLRDRWTKRAESEAGLSLGDLMEMSELSVEQVKHGFEEEPRLKSCGLAVSEAVLPLLRFLATLTPEQQDRLVGGEALPLAMLLPPQRAQLLQALAAATRTGGPGDEGRASGGTVELWEPSRPGAEPSAVAVPLASRRKVWLQLKLLVAGEQAPRRQTLLVSVPNR